MAFRSLYSFSGRYVSQMFLGSDQPDVSVKDAQGVSGLNQALGVAHSSF